MVRLAVGHKHLGCIRPPQSGQIKRPLNSNRFQLCDSHAQESRTVEERVFGVVRPFAAERTRVLLGNPQTKAVFKRKEWRFQADDWTFWTNWMKFNSFHSSFEADHASLAANCYHLDFNPKRNCVVCQAPPWFTFLSLSLSLSSFQVDKRLLVDSGLGGIFISSWKSLNYSKCLSSPKLAVSLQWTKISDFSKGRSKLKAGRWFNFSFL